MLTPEEWADEWKTVSFLNMNRFLNERRERDICSQDIELAPERIEIRRRLVDLVEEAARDNLI